MRPNRSVHGLALLALLVAPTAAYPADADLEQALAADRGWLLAYNSRGFDVFDRTWTDDAQLVSTDGRVKSKAEERADVAAPPPPQLKAQWSVSEQQGRRYGDTAIIIGRFAQSGTFDGQAFERPFRYTNVYVRQAAGWRLVSSQFAKIPR